MKYIIAFIVGGSVGYFLGYEGVIGMTVGMVLIGYQLTNK